MLEQTSQGDQIELRFDKRGGGELKLGSSQG